MTSSADRLTLLAIARNAIAARLEHRKAAPESLLPSGASEPTGSGGAFVTLKLYGELRGCIGHIESRRPIRHTIAELALSAAFSDPRFMPLSAKEFAAVHIEISRLSEFFPIREEDIKVGVHGLLLRAGSRSGLLLPQVAPEQGWDCHAFLGGLCRKAGLADGSWRRPEASLEAFTAEVFGE
ncbi:MAG: hypothetical protein B0D92_00615 [Spirochaeta sp. LUC14_002_19_P3]|nr:MAG: hypothetical protein B0D92_00615 [Spirochaeta sp. LUC14_002_19_P3]